MALDWKVLQRAHVQQASELVQEASPGRARGLFVVHGDRRLPAKEVVRVAYLLATSQPLETRLTFASGDSTLILLRKLGCQVARV